MEKKSLVKPNVQIKQSSIHCYGVFATKDFSSAELIEECPVIAFRSLQMDYRKEIDDREFVWDDDHDAIALGYGSVYNHADNFNAKFSIDCDDGMVRIIAAKPIAIDEEILVDYGENWFTDRKLMVVTLDEQDKANKKGMYKFFGLIIVLFMLSKIFPVQLSSDVSSSPQSKKVLACAVSENKIFDFVS